MRIFVVLTLSVLMLGCGGGSDSNDQRVKKSVNPDVPKIFAFLYEGLTGDSISASALEGETVTVRHILVDDEMNEIDETLIYWKDSAGEKIKEGNSLKISRDYFPSVTPCAIPKLSDGRVGPEFCSLNIAIKLKPRLSDKILDLMIYDLGDELSASVVWNENPDDNEWKIKWYDAENIYQGEGLKIKTSTLKVDKIKACIYQIEENKRMQCTELNDVPNNNPIETKIYSITGKLQKGHSIEVQHSEYTPYATYTSSKYKWLVSNVEKSQSKTLNLEPDYFGKDIEICVTNYFKNYRDSGTYPGKEDCYKFNLKEESLQTEVVYDVMNNNFIKNKPIVFSGKFISINKINWDTLILSNHGSILKKNIDFSLDVLNEEENYFLIKIFDQ
ncbi:hypothetical protein NB573_22975, partial [Vibrio alginolyticus]|uniref:hypothetical protein n=1 Tax=Vibrio alginolyticus TaxID=663 RepID=UPI00215BB4E0